MDTQVSTMLRPQLHSILLDITANMGLINITVACHQIKQRQNTTLSLIPWPVLLDHETPTLLSHYHTDSQERQAEKGLPLQRDDEPL